MNDLNHLAIIMDGNGRWAKKQSLIRTKGHLKGADNVENVAKFALDEKIKNLSLYAFSTENWKRPKSEVDFLMELLKKFLVQKEKLFLENGIKFYTFGNIEAFDNELKDRLNYLKEITAKNDKLNLALALNYGGRDEIIRAIKKINETNLEINEKNLNSLIESSIFGDVDLLIRTGGEHRVSNFMLWGISYAEIFFTPTLWPDFSKEELSEIVKRYKNVKRRFGGLWV